MKKYLLLKPDEDGNPVSILSGDEVQDISQLMEDYGVERWLGEFTEDNPQYWKEGEAMLLEVKLKVPKPVKVIEKYSIED